MAGFTTFNDAAAAARKTAMDRQQTFLPAQFLGLRHRLRAIGEGEKFKKSVTKYCRKNSCKICGRQECRGP